MAQRSRGKPKDQVKIAKERIAILFEEAEEMVKKDKKLANRYVHLARRIGMRYNVKTTAYRRQYCRKCKSYLKPGLTSKHSVKNGNVIIECLSCKNITKIPLKKKAKK